jgi:hypothetical protein
MNDSPQYLLKYRNFVGPNPSVPAMGVFLDALTASDWEEFVHDLLVTQRDAVFEVVAPLAGDELVDYAARLICEASPLALAHYSRALEQELAHAHQLARAGGDVERLLNGLRLVQLLGAAASPRVTFSIFQDSAAPREARVKAGFALAAHPDSTIAWRDYEKDLFLLAPIVAGLSNNDPRQAIHALVAADHKPDNSEMLKYPLRLALRYFWRQEGLRATARLVCAIPEKHWSYEFLWESVLSAAEFNSVSQQISEFQSRQRKLQRALRRSPGRPREPWDENTLYSEPSQNRAAERLAAMAAKNA